MSEISYSINPRDLDWVRKKFAPTQLKTVLSHGLLRGLIRVHEKLPPYPEVRQLKAVTKTSALYSRGARKAAHAPGRFWASSYKRTGTLGKSITEAVRIEAGVVVGTLGTNVTRKSSSSGYAEYVIGDNQAWMHQGRWWQLSVEFNKNVGEVEGSVVAGIDEHFAKESLPASA